MLERDRELVFDKRQTNIAKGIAIVFLLWHHLFSYFPDAPNSFISLYLIKGIAIETILASYLRVCVAMFLFLSGFGMYKSWDKFNNNVSPKTKRLHILLYQLVFVKTHILKLLLNFCFIYILFVPFSIWLGTPFWKVYINPFFGIMDFLGLANLTGTPTMNQSWWFMSLIILLYFLFPILAGGMKKLPNLMLAIAVALLLLCVLNFDIVYFKYKEYYLPFIFGMFFARRDIFEFIKAKVDSRLKKIVLLLPVICLSLLFRYFSGNKTYFDFILSAAIILISYFFVSKVKILSNVLEFFGRYSDSIYMFHLFINYYYFQTYIFSLKYSLIIFLFYSVVCILLAILVQKLKQLLRMNKLYLLL